jgi:glycosyltransferase involved in cell wall biosynthesis
MKQILHILEAVEGGTWRHLQDLVGALHGKGYTCSVVLSFERNAVNLDNERSFLASKSMPLYEIPMKRGAAPGDMTAVLKLTKLLRRLKPDLLHAHSSKAGILGRLASKLAGVPAVYTPHCFPFLMKDDKLSRFYGFIEKGVVKMTSAIIVISRQELEAARSLGYPESRIHYIPNGIESCGLDLPEICDKGSLKLGFFGRNGAQKGGDTFIRLVDELNRRGVSCEGTMYGVNESERSTSNIEHRTLNLNNEPSVERYETVSMCGGCPQDQVVGVMRGFDVIVMPSRWEGFPYVLLEALDAGVPLCVYNVGGIADVVEDGVSAMLTESEDFEGLLKNITKLRCAELRREIAAGGREAVKSYTLERMAESTLGVYEKTINDKR